MTREVTCAICGELHEVVRSGPLDVIPCPKLDPGQILAVSFKPTPENVVVRPFLEDMRVVSSCDDCPLRNNDPYGDSDCNLGGNLYDTRHAPEWCPLREATVVVVLHEKKS